ncbi:hypothetical protein LCGC14_2819510 [marine sediment metagenome]|uniref:VRR-NUC domain-containing protein n=1 Tax=marine sediment metagenome TaxID=412755 RepID=A0A0F8YHE5_9ZZZZ
MRPPNPLEAFEQRQVKIWLDSRRTPMGKLVWTHFPLGRKRSKIAGAKLKAEGAKSGFPDNIIFDPPPNVKPTDEQTAWLLALSDRGWETFVAKGAGDAVRKLRALGY